ncbi:hypothetical protein lerEdw1_004435 [Lerista edwardsae]|nr:hypothetical protein lerEdw1_004435 [Lerista edwardsae]
MIIYFEQLRWCSLNIWFQNATPPYFHSTIKLRNAFNIPFSCCQVLCTKCLQIQQQWLICQVAANQPSGITGCQLPRAIKC